MENVPTIFRIVALLIFVFPHPEAAGRNEPGSADRAFSMEVDDRFRIADGGVVITGVVASGSVSVGDSICLGSEAGDERALEVTGIETFRKIRESASAGDRVGLLVVGVDLDEIAAGDTVGPCP